MVEAVIGVLFRDLPSGDMSFARFRQAWKEQGLRLVHLIPHAVAKSATREEEMAHIHDIYRPLVNMLYTNRTDLRVQIYALYALYTLHETQVTTVKYKINLPECAWSTLWELKKVLRNIPDALAVLSKMIKNDMFAWSLDFAYEQIPELETSDNPNNLRVEAKESIPHTRLAEFSRLDVGVLARAADNYQQSLRALGMGREEKKHQPAVLSTTVSTLLDKHNTLLTETKAKRLEFAKLWKLIPTKKAAEAAAAAAASQEASAQEPPITEGPYLALADQYYRWASRPAGHPPPFDISQVPELNVPAKKENSGNNASASKEKKRAARKKNGKGGEEEEGEGEEEEDEDDDEEEGSRTDRKSVV